MKNVARGTEAVEKARNVTITCVDTKDCNVKWARATQWVSGNSYFKLQIANESIITTEGPINSAAIAHNSAISVNRLPKGDGTSSIVFKSWCANEFGCVPSHEILLTRFADFVNGGQPASRPCMTGLSPPCDGRSSSR